MEHQYAAENHIVEKYLLEEMDQRERDAFEEHYFSCVDCAEAVRMGTYFADNARAEAKSARQDEAVRPTRPGERPGRVVEIKTVNRPPLSRRFAPAMGVAAALLLAVVGYQNLRVEQPRIVTATMLRPVARGDERVIARQPGQKWVALAIETAGEKPYPHYRANVETPAGQALMQVDGEASADGTLVVEVPSSRLPPGHYLLLVRGQAVAGDPSGPEIARSGFFVKE